MKNQEIYTLIGEAMQSESKEMYLAEWATSSIFDPDPDGPEPDYDNIIEILGDIWDVTHMSINDMRKAAGVTQWELCERFCIPRRTVEHWGERGSGRSETPIYVRLMIAELLGIWKRPV